MVDLYTLKFNIMGIYSGLIKIDIIFNLFYLLQSFILLFNMK